MSMTNFGLRSARGAGCARLKEQQSPQFWNTNGKFKGFGSVWEAAMCQYAALCSEGTSWVCVCVFPTPVRSLKHLNPKANYGKTHFNIKAMWHSPAFTADQRKRANICVKTFRRRGACHPRKMKRVPLWATRREASGHLIKNQADSSFEIGILVLKDITISI